MSWLASLTAPPPAPAAAKASKGKDSKEAKSPWDDYDKPDSSVFAESRVHHEMVNEKLVKQLLDYPTVRRLREKTGHLMGYTMVTLLQCCKNGFITTVWTQDEIQGHRQRWYSGLHRLGDAATDEVLNLFNVQRMLGVRRNKMGLSAFAGGKGLRSICRFGIDYVEVDLVMAFCQLRLMHKPDNVSMPASQELFNLGAESVAARVGMDTDAFKAALRPAFNGGNVDDQLPQQAQLLLEEIREEHLNFMKKVVPKALVALCSHKKHPLLSAMSILDQDWENEVVEKLLKEA